MGCFNVKCGLTGMDIVVGDPVVLLFGYLKPEGTEYCGGWEGQPHQFQLLATPVFGAYNDYGWIEDVEDASWVLALKTMDLMLGGNVINLAARAADSYDPLRKKIRNQKGYTLQLAWVHRKAWDALIKATDSNLCHDFEKLETTGLFKIEDMIKFMKANNIGNGGYNNLNDDRYQGREVHWVSIDGDAKARFLLCDWMQSHVDMDIRAQRRAKMQAVRDDLSQHMTDEVEIERLVDILVSTPSSSENTVLNYIIYTKLGWFFPFPGRIENDERALATDLIKLCDQDQSMFKITAAFYRGLFQGRMVVRSEDTMNSSGQCIEKSVELAHRAVAKAVISVADSRLRKIKDQDDDED